MTETKIHKIDASGKSLGRLAAEIAVMLRGKGKAEFLRHVDMGERVEVYNVKDLKFTVKKLEQKIYYKHSGYPGGLAKKNLGEKFAKDPIWVLRQAVFGMLPKNKTRSKTIKRLKIFKSEL
jgi:large subunit ribosomal protein L13